MSIVFVMSIFDDHVFCFVFITLKFHPRLLSLAYVHIIFAHLKCANYSTYFRVNYHTYFLKTNFRLEYRQRNRNSQKYVELWKIKTSFDL